MSTDFVVFEVRREQDGAAHAAVVDALETWCFLPYPACTRKHLEQVNVFLTASIAPSSAPTATGMIGAVGIVLVPLSPGAQVEGYIQVVLVHPSHRRRHVARELLRRALQLAEGGDGGRRIARWRLHTMMSSPQTTAYLRSVLAESSGGGASCEQELEEMEGIVAAMPGVYEKMGFTVRRNIYAYYANSADAVEMVKVVTGAGRRR